MASAIAISEDKKMRYNSTMDMFQPDFKVLLRLFIFKIRLKAKIFKCNLRNDIFAFSDNISVNNLIQVPLNFAQNSHLISDQLLNRSKKHIIFLQEKF